MESSGSRPAPAVDASEIARFFAGQPPFASVYLSTPSDIPNAAQVSETHWKSVRREMREADVPEEILEAIDALVPDAHLEGETLAVIATADGGVDVVDHLPAPPHADAFRWGAVPWTGPLVEARQRAITHVMVTADRTGADIIVVKAGGDEIHREVKGDGDWPITKSKPGGWSQRRYQQRAENTWEHNADDVAAEITRIVDRTGARLIVATGDVRAMELMQESLPKRVLAILEVVEGDPDNLASETVRLVDTLVASDTVAYLEKFREETGQHDRAADGVGATVAALDQSQVDVLLVHDDPDDDRTLWFGDDPIPISTSPADLKGLGVDSPVEGRLVDVVIRAAAGTGAGVRIVPKGGGPEGAVGAILRWT